MEKFYITFRNPQETFTLYYTIRDHSVAQLWKRSIKENFINPDSITNCKPLDKEFCMHGWIRDWNSNHPRNLDVVCEQLNQAIAIINNNLGPKGYPHIDLHYTKQNMQGPEYRDLMNQIHHHFELLIGQVWSPSDWMLQADPITQFAIQELNFRCHEIEGIVGSITDHKGKAVYLGYNNTIPNQHYPAKKRYELQDSDYLCWENTIREWGMITCYYSQLGKTHKEAFQDNDDHIDKENISAVRYMTGEAILNFTNNAPGSNKQENFEEFDAWLQDNGWDPQDPSLAKGICVIGTVDLNGHDWIELDEKLNQMEDVYEIGFVDSNNDVVVKQTYPVTWQENRQILINNYIV